MKAKKLAKHVHAACHEAAMQCPQFHGFDDDQQVLVGGRWVEFGDVPKKGLEAVIRFWRDTDSQGGDLLFNGGYEAELPGDVAALFSRVDVLVGQAIEQAAREYRG